MRPCLACAIGPYRLDASSPCEMRVHVCRCPLVLSIHFYTCLFTYLSLYNTVMSIYTILSSTVCRTQSSTPSLHSVYVYSVYTQSSCVYTCVYNMCRVAVWPRMRLKSYVRLRQIVAPSMAIIHCEADVKMPSHPVPGPWRFPFPPGDFPDPPVIFPTPQEIRLSLGFRISSTRA